MQLVAYGAQDIYLTGNPQITFFKVVYRRHTNFAMESIEQVFTGNVTLGKKTSCTIARNGDLVQEIYVQGTSSANPSVSTAEVEIGGQKIDKHYSQWLDIYNELFETSHDYRYVMNSTSGTSANPAADVSVTHYIPLRFWFNRNPGLALPLIALQYHDVKLKLQLNELDNLIHTDGSSVSTSGSISELKLYVDYIFLDTDERRRFAQISHEYLIE